jgi:hypothetical protein
VTHGTALANGTTMLCVSPQRIKDKTMNNDSHNDLARYHGFPPLSPPHEPNKKLDDLLARVQNAPPMTDEEFASQKRNFAYGNASFENPDITRAIVYQEDTKPTPTIPQMSDRHEQAILREKLAVWLTRATVSFSIVAMSLFIASLIYRATVGVY